MDISLIIPAYNEEDYIGACIDSALKNGRGRFKEIIVVDNASTDKTAEVARNKGALVVREERKGLTSARQSGLEASTSELIAYIDADTHLTPQWVDIVERTFRERPDIVSLSGPRRHFGTVWYRRWILNAVWVVAPLTYYVVGYMILGGNFVAKRSAIEKIGGFDRSIAFYGEDTDLARRLSKVGKTLFRMDFYVYASARRYEHEGMLKANGVYVLNYLWPVFFGRPFSKAYRDVR
ncbi:MAG: glycosyltransferase family A protein [bacterium]|nr:glycosyltransferase family A protein [bacterium]